MQTLLWLGSYLSDEMVMEVRRDGYKDPAAVLSQKNILEGIERVSGKTFDAIGALTLKGYPYNKTSYIKERKFSHADGAEDTLVGYLNIQYLNRLTSRKSLVKAVRRWLKRKQPSELDVFVYAMRSACLCAAKAIKKKMPHARIHLIVPDLPQFMDLSMSGFKKMLKKFDWQSIRKNMRYVDDYILYSAPMASYLGIEDKKWMLMEGSISEQEIAKAGNVTEDLPVTDKVVMMYSGSIKAGFGIKRLLDSMQYLDDGYELWFTGGGDAASLVKEYAEKDSRIKYYGFLPTRDDLKKLQAQATVLVNMRLPEEPASRYCFPSKLFEYMLSGKPVLTCRLDGIPEEYYEYLITIDEATPEGIAKAMQGVSQFSGEQLMEIAQKGKDFVSSQKNNKQQAMRIMAFVEN